MPTFAAVDIGANSVRLKIARVVKHRLQVVHEDREVTRLGEHVFKTSLLSPYPMSLTIKALRRFHRAVQTHGVDLIRVVATSALRDARNSRAFQDWVHAATGWSVEVISGLEEGRLIHLGVLSTGRISRSRVLLVDLGGGSCEFTVSVQGHIQSMHSLPLGAVRLSEEFLNHDPPKKREIERLQGFIRKEINRIIEQVAAVRVEGALATSGTALALSELGGYKKYAALASGKRGVTSTAGIAHMAEDLGKLPLEARKRLPGIGPRRAEIIVGGAMVFAEFLSRLRLPGFRYSPLGLRDGILAQMLVDFDSSTSLHRQIASERHDAIMGLARHYAIDFRFANRIRDYTLDLFQQLRAVHQLPSEYSEFLAAAAMLHEVGSFVNRTGRHRHTYYIIANSEMFGFNTHQRRVIAAITRYVGNSRPAADARAMRELSAAERDQVQRAVLLLRLARALDQGRQGRVGEFRSRVHQNEVRIALRGKKDGADLELWALEKERPYFREVFGRELTPAMDGL